MDKECFSQSSKSINYRITAGYCTHLASPLPPVALRGFLESQFDTTFLVILFLLLFFFNFLWESEEHRRNWISSLTSFCFSIFLKKIYLFLFYAYECITYTYVHKPITSLVLQGPEKFGGSPGTGLIDGSELLRGYWELNSKFLQEQKVLLTTKASPQPMVLLFLYQSTNNLLE